MEALKLLKRDDSCQDKGEESIPINGAVCERHDKEVKFNLYGEEVIHKTVTASGSCGRVYLPLAWVGKRVKIIRVN